MVKAKWIMVAVVTALILVACIPSDPVDFSCSSPILSSPPLKSNNLTINIYVDGTPSMEGYANTDTKSHYSQTLELLDSIASFSSAKVAYNRLGTYAQPITRGQFHKDTQSPTFYNGRDRRYPKFQETTIDKAITPVSKDNQLSIIITDLYQEDSDITKVSKEIQKNYLNSDQVAKGDAVGILASKSEFNGIVYNEDLNNTKFHYNTHGKPEEKYHPFYALFLGKYSDIDDFFTKIIKDGGELVNKSKLVIFSPDYILRESLHFPSHMDNKDNNKLLTNIDVRRPSSLQSKKVVVDKKNVQSIDLLEIGKNEKQEISLSYDVPFTPFDHTLLFDDKSLKTQVKIDGFDTFSKKVDKTNDSSLQQAIEIRKLNLNEQQRNLNLSTTIKPNKMPSGIYFFTIDTIAKDLQEQPWWEKWNSTESNKTDGSKTFNILKFLQQLKHLTTELMVRENSKSIIGRFCYAIQKD
jgi:hypothetical protein